VPHARAGFPPICYKLPPPALEALCQAAPPLKDLLTLRMAAAKVPPADGPLGVWSVLQSRLEGLDNATVLGDAKMTTGLLDRLTYHCDIVEIGNDSWRLKNHS
jgi:IstB-like ATP binding protein